MNVKIITRHSPANYGSLLQAFATGRVIEELGHKAEIIDYRRADECGLEKIRVERRLKPRWNGNPLMRFAYMVLRAPADLIAERRFSAFRKSMLTMTDKVAEKTGLEKLDADLFMTGSDQVWGRVGELDYDPMYYLDFTLRDKVAYAASFGKTAPADVARYLAAYRGVTVREDAAADQIERMGLPRPEQVLDPTLLIDADGWSDAVGLKEEVTKPYILVYQLHKNAEFTRRIRETEALTGLKAVRMSASFHQIGRPGHFVWLPSPARFLQLIRDARLLVTDSFHGTAFALNFNTPFVTVLPNNATESRNLSLLRLTGTEDRIVAPDSNIDDILSHPIDFERVNDILSSERSRSMQILKELI